MSRFTADAALAPLKDFQLATAEHVFARLYTDPDPVRRFLIADEVGLGKTLVARGVIAKTIEHLQDVVERVDIVYVCSNALIARQNLQRLRVGKQEHFELAERITMLPVTAHKLSANKINLVSFTPGTSFEVKAGTGTARERAILRLVLGEAWGQEWLRRRGSMRIFQGGVRTLERFRRVYDKIARAHGATLDQELVQRFARVLDEQEAIAEAKGDAGPWERFEELCHTYGYNRPKTGWAPRDNRHKNRFIGDLRDWLARSCLEALRPDLIILDEFQRFKHLLAAPDTPGFNPAAELAHELFDHTDHASGSEARVLLLSATPYKMHTNHADDEDHHEDLVETVRFLLENDQAGVEGLRRDLRSLRRGLMQIGRDGGAAAREARDAVQTTLRRVMVRTERLAATPDRSGMLQEQRCEGLRLDEESVSTFLASARLSRHLGVPDPLEYWKSAPYLLNFADRYRIGEELDVAATNGTSGVAPFVRDAELLPFDKIERFKPISLEHPRLRWLVDSTVRCGAWQLLWVPPSLPYLAPGGPYRQPDLQGFSKRLIFSSWTIVPAAITTLLSYEAERRMVSGEGRPRYRNTPVARQNQARLLDFTYSNERLTGMPVLGVLYPSVVLADLGDPLELARDNDGDVVPAEQAVEIVAARLQPRLDALVATIEEAGGEVPRGGREDERWYWAAPILLDWLEDEAYTHDLLRERRALEEAFVGGDRQDGGARFREHLSRAREVGTGARFPEFLAMPSDLAKVLARMALGGPGVTALRSLARTTGRQLDDTTARFAACRVAWGLRTLFNNPEVTSLVNHLYPGEPYWKRLVDYAIAGNLQAVLDEYAYVLVSARGHLDASKDEVVDDIAEVMHDTVRLRTVRYGVSRIEIDGDRVDIQPAKLRANFALRLSDERSDDGTQTRLSDVREAFNSPFRPFVLATTSAGQEGLDFHPYCHAVVHWNLPSNPVDLEQREGRVHRFQGHAIRRNVADDYAGLGRTSGGDPWQVMFDAAHRDRPDELSDIVPYWVTPDGDTRVHRFVPALPLSSDRARAARLKQAVASYRLAFGQPRQDELLAYLEGEVDPDELERLAADLKIDIAPSKPKAP